MYDLRLGDIEVGWAKTVEAWENWHSQLPDNGHFQMSYLNYQQLDHKQQKKTSLE